MKISEIAIKKPLLVHVFSILIIFAGLIALQSLHRETFPAISLNKIIVQTTYPGATPQDIEKLITIPIEKELKEVDNIKEMVSVSAESYSVVTLDIDEDIPSFDRVLSDVQRAVDQAEDLPSDLETQPLVFEVNTRNQPVITVSLSSAIDYRKLKEITQALEKKLLDIPEVASINRRGWKEEEIWVEVDIEKKKELYISFNEIVQALQKQNISIPAGELYENNIEYAVRTTGEFFSSDEIKNIILRSNPGGKRVQVKDIAEVIDTYEEEKTITKTLGEPAINLTVVKKANIDTINLTNEIRKIASDFISELNENIEISFINDASYYIERRQKVLLSNGAIGMLFVILALFSFLSKRVAFGACLGIPIVILATFTLMQWFGISINLLSMFGMIMVVGMIVDEEIVISENVNRHYENGLPFMEAISRGMMEVGPAVFTTVATTISAFIPLLLMEGTTGRFIKHIPLTVAITLLSSLMVAIIILPTHIYELLKKAPHNHQLNKAQSYLKKLNQLYNKLIEKSLKRKYLVCGGLIFVFFVSLYLAIFQMDRVMFPSGGVQLFYIRSEGQVGETLKETELKIKKVENILNQYRNTEVESYVTHLGYHESEEQSSSNRGSHLAQIDIHLKADAERKLTVDELTQKIRSQLNDLSLFKTISIDLVKHGGSRGKDIEVQIKGDNLDQMKNLAQNYRQTLSQIDGVQDIKDDFSNLINQIKIEVDAEKAAQAYLSVNQVAITVRAALEGVRATKIKSSENEIDVMVRLPLNAQNSITSIESLLIENSRGNLIPFKQIASIKKESGLRQINHVDGSRTITVSANVDTKQTSGYLANQKLIELFENQLRHYPNLDVKYRGSTEDLDKSFGNLLSASYIAIALIFIILIAMFQSLRMTSLILITLPFSLIGTVLALYIHGLPLSFMALLGLVGLTGVIANNGIIMIDFIQKARQKGLGLKDSILEGSKLRFRPILLTTITTALGVIPAAYGLGGLDPFVQPMALVLNYGLVFGAFLSLFFIPCAVSISDDLFESYQKLFNKRNKLKSSL